MVHTLGRPTKARSATADRSGQRLELGQDRRTDRLVLRAVTAADPDAADDLAVEDERKPADEDGELARQHVADTEGLIARQCRAVRRLVEQMGGPLVARGSERFGDGDVDAGQPSTR